MAKPSTWVMTVRHFYKTTTLHGFKYLGSKFFSDRVGWLLCCCASACCAGVLCAVLWARFTQVPALITLRDLLAEPQVLRLSNIAFCPAAGNIAYLFQQNLVTDNATRTRLPAILSLVLRRKPLTDSQAELLEGALNVNNLTLVGALTRLMPPCSRIIRNCRWLTMTLPCGDIFQQELTQWGLCCVMRPNEIQLSSLLTTRFTTSRRLITGMQFSDHSRVYGCEFFTKYPGEEWVEPVPLTPGYNYIGSLTSTSIVDSDADKLVNNRCVYKDHYTRSNCMIKCKEKLCGCADPLQSNEDNETSGLPTCSIPNLNCLRTYKDDNLSCNCLPSCRRVSTDLSLEFSPMNAFEHVYDNVYEGLNASQAVVLSLHIKITDSKKFVVNPTETWITLLSSLGGVFNMFLGVGLFSALELLFLIFVKLPIALRKSKKLPPLK
ncbi:sodium channel protein Nach [Papilio machaon]|uniref:sodium channel protein Nach n=1 Tax=Papilio machaon TaxID=76193 RepID=UPI001E665F4D|nr:sodium channel protein Nach [Papilio machaon]